jgi:hypothetical protein
MAERQPTAAEVWAARFRRAWERVAAEDKLVVDMFHELLEASGDGPQLVLGDGGWAENPHHGDRAFYAAEERRLWGELGERLGIGPPPDSFHA